MSPIEIQKRDFIYEIMSVSVNFRFITFLYEIVFEFFSNLCRNVFDINCASDSKPNSLIVVFHKKKYLNKLFSDVKKKFQENFFA